LYYENLPNTEKYNKIIKNIQELDGDIKIGFNQINYLYEKKSGF
jgi:hypothetical protein